LGSRSSRGARFYRGDLGSSPALALGRGRGSGGGKGGAIRRVFRRGFLLLSGIALLGALVFLATTAAELAAESKLLEVQSVVVRGNAYVTDEVIVSQLGDIQGLSLLALDPEKLEARLRKHPRLLNAKVRRHLDRRLLVEVEERRPIALLGAGVMVEVDANGVVLPPVARGALPDLPILVGLGTRLPAPGTRLQSPALRGALDLLQELGGTDPEFLAMVSEIDLSRSPIYRLHLVGRSAILVAHARSLSPAKLSGVRAVLDDLERRGRNAVEVDLRFEGQLVVRELK
jgi:cell division protein FtsQ